MVLQTTGQKFNRDSIASSRGKYENKEFDSDL